MILRGRYYQQTYVSFRLLFYKVDKLLYTHHEKFVMVSKTERLTKRLTERLTKRLTERPKQR